MASVKESLATRPLRMQNSSSFLWLGCLRSNSCRPLLNLVPNPPPFLPNPRSLHRLSPQPNQQTDPRHAPHNPQRSPPPKPRPQPQSPDLTHLPQPNPIRLNGPTAAPNLSQDRHRHHSHSPHPLRNLLFLHHQAQLPRPNPSNPHHLHLPILHLLQRQHQRPFQHQIPPQHPLLLQIQVPLIPPVRRPHRPGYP